MVNFSSQPDEIIVSERRNQQHEAPLDPLDMDTEKPYMSHIEQQLPTEGHSLGAMSTRDTEKGTGYASSIDGEGRHEVSERAEKKLLRKLDVIILPLAALLYLSAYLDRGNLGNARLQGLQKEVLDNDSDKYSLALACFYITYIVLSIPGTLLAKQINPSTAISIGALIWSIAATCQAAIQNPAGLYVCRLFVGVGESMFGQSMTLYFSIWYLKGEIAKRVSLFIGAGVVAGSLGGLIAFGVSSINHSSIDKWRILFLVEGLPSLVLAIVVFLFLPSRPQVSRYLNEDERTVCITRLNRENNHEVNAGIDWRGVRRAFTDWKVYVLAVMYSCMNLTLGSVSGFLPTIIKGLGYTEARAQLFTVPPYAVALVVMVSLAAVSDKLRTRGIPAASVFVIGIVGWVLLLTISPVKPSASHLHIRYFGCICIVTAGYCAIPIIMSWQASSSPNQSQRAVALGMLNTIGQCLSVLASYSFPTSQGPKFTKGITLNIAFQAFGFALALAMSAYFRWENKRRDRVEGPRAEGERLNVIEEFDLAPGFRYTP
ncbi:hypothetical protein NliqN6_5256 [Naganishia liquefaciens]|uniref:Major facilitator superfamily (MFS) profile domain-containing protein n=1 Tax=Naganishia liquefaciens TaxID=104408 RepID=A0A8H3YGK7_9TREE|nr:hypothetical protein NliqN6_5256 [Naganishia liquefaciens]